jgi:hypothetical protein
MAAERRTLTSDNVKLYDSTKRGELYMPPYSGMKVVHDEMIHEALERRRYYDGQEPHRHGLLKTFGKALIRFTAHSDEKQAQPLPGCACQAREA